MRRRIVGVLFAVAPLAAGAAVGIAYRPESALAGTSVALLVAASGYLVLPTVPGVLATAAASVSVLVALMTEVLDLSALSNGLLILVLGLLWTAIGVAGLVTPRWLPLTIGLGLCLVGAQLPLAGPDTQAEAYLLTIAVAVASFTLYRWHRLTVLLLAGVIGVTLAVPEAVADWTDGALGGAVILLIAGAALVAASALSLRLRNARDTGNT